MTYQLGPGKGLEEYIAKLEADNAALRKLLQRLSEWDHMDTAADGPYWRSEIATALAGKVMP